MYGSLRHILCFLLMTFAIHTTMGNVIMHENSDTLSFDDITHNRSGVSIDTIVCTIPANNIFTQEMFPKSNVVYIIKHDYDLDGKEIIIPKGCVLQFMGGSLRNGVVIGDGTELSYENPFLDKIILKGGFVTSKIPIDTDIFIDSNYNGDRIKSMFCIHGINDRIVFSNNLYSNVETINLTRNIDADFSGSILRMNIDERGLPVPFIYVDELNESSDSYLNFFKLKNATIIGNEEFEYDGKLLPKTIHSGLRRRCIQLFKVDEVVIDNVNFYHIEVGTLGKYHLPLRKRYELSIVSIMYYNMAEISNCKLHDCSADNLISLIPNVAADNLAVISDCICYRNYTGLLMVHDGRCKVYNNSCYDCNSSAMNLFCYDSDIYGNYFENTHTDCIDLSEVGLILSHNVKIHDNIARGIADFCDVRGKDIFIYNNDIECSTADGFAVDTYTTSEPWEYNDSQNNIQDSSYFSCYIIKNKIKGNITRSTYGGGISVNKGHVIDYLLIEGNNCERQVIQSSNNSANPICLTNVRRAIIRNNNIKGFSKVNGASDYMSLWQLFESPTDKLFESVIDISSNVFEIDKGSIRDNMRVSLGAQFDNGTTNLYSVTINYTNNIVKPADVKLVDFVKLGAGLTKVKIYQSGNKGFLEDVK